jgi:hypothetical protein
MYKKSVPSFPGMHNKDYIEQVSSLQLLLPNFKLQAANPIDIWLRISLK